MFFVTKTQTNVHEGINRTNRIKYTENNTCEFIPHLILVNEYEI